MTRVRKRDESSDEAGFSLVELMVAVILIAIGILPIAAVQSGSTRDVVATGQHTRALSVAQGQMEVARAAGFGVAATDSGQTGVYSWRTDVNTVATGLVQVDVTVTWTEQGTPRTLELNNLISTR